MLVVFLKLIIINDAQKKYKNLCESQSFYLFIYFFTRGDYRSGTGKSTLLKSLVGALNADAKVKTLYLLNVGASETASYSKLFHTVAKLDNFELLSQTKKNSVVLVEDIISIDKSDEQSLRKVLNYDAHHKRQKIFCVSHSIYKTSLWSCLSFFHYIIFTSAPSNIPVIRFTLNYFKIEKSQLESWLNKFVSLGKNGRQGVYFFFDCVKMTFNLSLDTGFTQLSCLGTAGLSESASPTSEVSEDKSNSLAAKKSLQESFETMADSLGDKKSAAKAIFAVLLKSVSPHLIRARDLSFAFKTKRGGEIRFSLLDYLATLVDSEAHISPPLKAFHKYVQKFCHIPKIFVANKAFES